jgi:hypothetical protein
LIELKNQVKGEKIEDEKLRRWEDVKAERLEGEEAGRLRRWSASSRTKFASSRLNRKNSLTGQARFLRKI